MRAIIVLTVVFVMPVVTTGGCESGAPPEASEPLFDRARVSSERFDPPKVSPYDPPTRFPAAKRIVAFGDVHGDLAATRRALRLGGAIDMVNRWIGGDLVVVQTGDQLDRGNEERAILDLFTRLEREAKQAGGAFHVLNGNHELMNAAGDLRYVTKGGFRDFAGARKLRLDAPEVIRLPRIQRPRAALFRPGGLYAKLLANRNTVVVIGDAVFAHGGVAPRHVEYGLEKLNQEVRDWLRGDREQPPDAAASRLGVTWIRAFSEDPDRQDCELLGQALKMLGAKRLIVGHTVRRGISSECEGKVWAIDVGLAAHYGGTTAVLELTKGQARVISDETHR